MGFEPHDKVAVITGAAGGIGLGMARAFVGAGMKVVLADFDAKRVEESAAALRADGHDAVGVVTDVSKRADVEAPLGLVMALSFGINRMSAGTAQLMFWLYAALNGVAFATIFIVYPVADITRVFFITAATFGALSLYGYTTPRSLTGFGSFLFMGLVGILIASVVNFFLASSAMTFAISVIGVLVFAGLTAYDTQKIKEMYAESDDGETTGKKAIMGALTLYLDFINLFLMLLRLLSNRN